MSTKENENAKKKNTNKAVKTNTGKVQKTSKPKVAKKAEPKVEETEVKVEPKVEETEVKVEPKVEETEVKTEPKAVTDNKKFKTILTYVIMAAIVLGLGFGLVFSGKLFSGGVKITKNEASQIKYEDYNNGLISLKIPKGWKVEVAPTDYIHYSFKVYNPKNTTYMLMFSLKLEGFLKTEKARKTYAKYYPDAIFSKLAAVDPQNAEGFFNVWNKNAKYSNENELKYNFFPYFDDFEIIDELGKNVLGGEILRATYTDDKGEKAQGLFTASVMSTGSYYINTDMWNLYSAKVDVWPLNVYNIIVMSAPDTEFNDWQSILDYSLSTLQFSDSFMKGFNQEETTITNTILANQKVYNEISDMIMDSWEKRNNSYDIISQKQSDATLGYERVYNTDTGEIYKATNGFMDSYDGTKYKAITDDMYNLPTSGYIEMR